MKWTWHILFPCLLVFVAGFQLWAIVVAGSLVALGLYLERRAKKIETARKLMFDFVLEEYSVAEALRYQSDPTTWVYPEVRHLMKSRTKYLSDMNKVREEQIEEAQNELQ